MQPMRDRRENPFVSAATDTKDYFACAQWIARPTFSVGHAHSFDFAQPDQNEQDQSSFWH